MNILIIGAGPVGCTLANLFSTDKKKNIQIIEKRDHIAGNCYDFYDRNNVLVHKYGPHYFRSNNKKIIKFLSNFTAWIDGNYYVKSCDKGKLFQFPINLNTLEHIYKKKFNKKIAENFFKEQKKTILNPKNFEEFLINKIGKDLYNKFYKNYTIKQWGLDPKKLNSNIAKRIPIRLNRNNKYLREKYQLMPKKGFTEMFKNMINKKNIAVSLNSKIVFNIKTVDDFINQYDYIFYSGPIDNFFNFKYGKLNWRSLKFKYKNFKKDLKQVVGQINYPNQFKYTRSVEYKHITKQKNKTTTISYEYPLKEGDPYYPVNTKEDHFKYRNYLKKTKELEKKKVFFVGRLAEYTYINTDEAIDKAIKLYKKISKKHNL